MWILHRLLCRPVQITEPGLTAEITSFLPLPRRTSVLVTSNSCAILPTNSVSFDFSRCVYMEGGVALNSSRERFPGTSFIPLIICDSRIYDCSKNTLVVGFICLGFYFCDRLVHRTNVIWGDKSLN